MKGFVGIVAVGTLVTCGSWGSPAFTAQTVERQVPIAHAARVHLRGTSAPSVSTHHRGIRRAKATGRFAPSLPRRATIRPEEPAYPDFTTLKPFSADTNYMSLLGYVRYCVHHRTGTWITYAEAAKIINAPRNVKRARA